MLTLYLALAVQFSTIPLLFLYKLPQKPAQLIIFCLGVFIYWIFKRIAPRLCLIFILTVILFIITLCRINYQQGTIATYKWGKQYELEGYISDITQTSNTILFNIIPNKLTRWSKQSIQLNRARFPAAVELAAGQKWKLKVILQQPIQRVNEASFNIYRTLISRDIWLTGRILQATLLDVKANLRQRLYSYLSTQWQHYRHFALFAALLFGVKGDLSSETFQLYQYSGVAHLIAISGLHILFLTKNTQSLLRWGLFFLPQRFRLINLPVYITWIVSLIYTWLAGWSLPTQRALLSFTLHSYCYLKGYYLTPWRNLQVVNAFLLLWNPLSILSSSYWLSLLAIMGLIIANTTQWDKNYSNRLLKNIIKLSWNQLSLSLTLLPISILYFQGSNYLNIFSNLIAIPLVAYLLLPLLFGGLFSSLLPRISHCCWWLSDIVLGVLQKCLIFFAENWISLSFHTLLTSLTLFCIFLLWHLRRFFLALFVVLLSLSIFSLFYIPTHYWRLDMLDVGHGLAVLITQGKQSILYDTGNGWKNSSEAKRVIIPFMRWHGFKLKKIIISHEDNDHMGGLNDLVQWEPTVKVMSSSLNIGEANCINKYEWIWGKLTFRSIWPLKAVTRAYNKDSCVIYLTDGYFTVLLTGDIEKKQEIKLIRTLNILQPLKQLTLLQVPHHGSNTSSSITFLVQLNPTIALISNGVSSSRVSSDTGYHPVLSRYNQLAIPVLMTKQSGQITLFFYKNSIKIMEQHPYFYARWYNKAFGNF